MKLTAVKTAKKHLYFNGLAVRRIRKFGRLGGCRDVLDASVLTAVNSGENRRHIKPLASSGGC